MSYIVSHLTETPGGSKRFKKVAEYPNADASFGFTGPDRAVKSIAVSAARDLGVTEGEFLVTYHATSSGEVWTAHVKVALVPTAEIV